MSAIRHAWEAKLKGSVLRTIDRGAINKKITINEASLASFTALTLLIVSSFGQAFIIMAAAKPFRCRLYILLVTEIVGH